MAKRKSSFRLLVALLISCLFGMSIMALSYDVPLRNKCFYTVNKSYPVVTYNSKMRQYGWGKAQLKLPVSAGYTLTRNFSR